MNPMAPRDIGTNPFVLFLCLLTVIALERQRQQSALTFGSVTRVPDLGLSFGSVSRTNIRIDI